jgi:DNA-directed RNA polymerase-3 subunit RPC5
MRVKPGRKAVQISYQLDQESDNHDPHARLPVKHFSLTSKVVPPKTNYAAGVFVEGALHLTPLHGTCRMMPDFEYLDEFATEELKSSKIENEEDKEKKEKKEKEIRPVVAHFKKRETEQSAAYRKQSYDHFLSNMASEQWIDLQHFAEETAEASTEFNRLLCTRKQPVEFDLSPRDYLAYVNNQALHPGSDLSHGFFDNDKQKVGARVTELVQSAHVVSFASICRYCNLRTEQQLGEALSELNKVAYVIQGNWVVRSSAYPVPASTFRDLVLLQFNRDCIIKRDALMKIVGVEYVVSTQIMEELAEILPDQQGWKFKLPFDSSFVEAFGDIVTLQQSELEKLGRKLEEDLKALPMPVSSAAAQAGEDAEAKARVHDAYKQAVASVFKRFSICHISILKKAALRKLPDVDFQPRVLKAVLQDLCVGLLGERYVLAARSPQLDPFRMCIANLFKGRMKLRKQDAKAAINTQFETELGDAVLLKILKEFANCEGGVYELQSGHHEEF